MCQPDVTTNHRIVADGDAPQNRGVGIYSHIVFNNRVARHVQHVALFVVFDLYSNSSWRWDDYRYDSYYDDWAWRWRTRSAEGEADDSTDVYIGEEGKSFATGTFAKALNEMAAKK